jgi:hypothetical protein
MTCTEYHCFLWSGQMYYMYRMSLLAIEIYIAKSQLILNNCWNLQQNKKKCCYGQITKVIYVSIMCLAGIHGNLVVDLETNNTPNDLVYNCAIQYTYIRYLVLKYILKRWHYSGDKQINNKLHEILSVVSKTPCCYGKQLPWNKWSRPYVVLVMVYLHAVI